MQEEKFMHHVRVKARSGFRVSCSCMYCFTRGNDRNSIVVVAVAVAVVVEIVVVIAGVVEIVL